MVGHLVFIAALLVATWELQQDNWTPWEVVTAANPRVKRTPNVQWLVCVCVTRYAHTRRFDCGHVIGHSLSHSLSLRASLRIASQVLRWWQHVLAVDVTTLPTREFTPLTRVAHGTRVYVTTQRHHAVDAVNSLAAFLAAGPLGGDLDNDVGAAAWLCLVTVVAAAQLLAAMASLPVPGRLMVAMWRALKRAAPCGVGCCCARPHRLTRGEFVSVPSSAGAVVAGFVGVAAVSVGAMQLLLNVGEHGDGGMVQYLHVALVGLPDGLSAGELVRVAPVVGVACGVRDTAIVRVACAG